MQGGARERIFGRNAAYEVLRAGRRAVDGLEVAEAAEARGGLKRLLDLEAAHSVRCARCAAAISIARPIPIRAWLPPRTLRGEIS